ncbi:MAG: SpoIVB peptidase [Clostridia bacterium]|nr:SpoIVB peptidase [Clostridia bacterium]
MKLIGFILALMIACLNFTDEMIAARALEGAVFTHSSAFDEETLLSVNASSHAGAQLFGSMSVSSSDDETLEDSSIAVRLFDLIDATKIRVYNGERKLLSPLGNAIGISIHVDGVVVVGFGEVTINSGESVCPAKTCGLQAGDIIKKLDGRDVCTANELQLALNSSVGKVDMSVDRNGRLLTVTAEPVLDAEGGLRLGAWVRDSTIGIGTLSFTDEETGAVAALGHAVLDADTQTLLPVLDGSISYADILGVVKGKSGVPGELKGTFSSKSDILGTVERNCVFGIFGRLNQTADTGLILEGVQAVPIAFPDEVHTGEACIYSQLDSGEPQCYSCRIIRTVHQNRPDQKGLVIEITDARLLDTAGGIVQGMSGSPIIQDGRLVGVVTHVFVNDPTKGYGAYAFWISEAMSDE